MAKGRMLNKTISIDKELSKLSKESLILYTWCIPHLDIKGRIFAEPEQIKGLVVPYIKWFTIDKIRKCISEISKTSLVLYYGEGFKYFEFTGFAKNQTVYEEREAKSIIPDPTQDELMSKSCVTHAEVEVEVKDKDNNTLCPLQDTEQEQFNLFKTDICKAWNELAGSKNIPCVKYLNDERVKNLLRLFRNKDFKDNWREVLEKAKPQSFLFGKNDRGWNMDFDFLLGKDKKKTPNWIKIMEEKYGHNRKN